MVARRLHLRYVYLSSPGGGRRRTLKANQNAVDAAATFADRIQYHRKILAKGVGKSPSAIMRRALDHCAYCMAQCELARADLSIPVTDRTAVFREARLAERHLQALKDGRESEPAPLELVDLTA